MIQFQFLRDVRQLAIGKRSVPTERLLGPVFVLMVLAIVAAPLAVLLSLRPVPVIRPAPQTLPVTEFASIVQRVAPVILPVVAIAPAPTPIAPVADDAVEYRVQHGDTLSAIARRYCGDYLAIARDNQIPDPNRIYAGKTVLKFKNGCAQAPQVLVKQSVSPRELVSNGGASSGKHISSLAPRDTEAQSLPLMAAIVPAPSASLPTQAVTTTAVPDLSRPLSEVRHREIYRIVALRKLGKDRNRSQDAELARLTALIRQEVLARYKLPNPDCLYAEAQTLGRNWEEQTLARTRCIRENYGATIDEVAAEYRLPAAYLQAIIITESGGKPDAISPTGCTGLKQFTIASAKRFGLPDRFDPLESIRAGGRHLESNLRQWRGNVAKATAHYNIGSVVVGQAGFNAAKFPYTQNVLRVKELIEKEIKRTATGQPHMAALSSR